ncbi:MarR family winged helix-turn-helix transcriptional regulator [Nocardioides daphniae]|uniref:MarR family transcriptional regulator n=1 Tax=Nocardioides daphniae TaxID=402297 RepID=A0A4P7U8I2_9ACTN|nr:MarR family transcriptional regulator [Nocardioides daphniae]QCC76483.1 MarR family transcriptional regulator [Nocardioides daphniae]GGD06309.1 putative transcriptional regulator, MarR family protein [Nocardioides daphniae]
MSSADPRQRDPITEARRQWVAHGWEDAADGMELVTSLVRAHQLLMERIDAVLRPLDLSFARYEVLRLLSFTHDGAMPMTRLGSLLQVHPTSVTSAVARLVKQGYAARERGAHDGRVVLASITGTGREVVERATERLNAEVFTQPGIEAGDAARLTELLAALRAASGDHVSA